MIECVIVNFVHVVDSSNTSIVGMDPLVAAKRTQLPFESFQAGPTAMLRSVTRLPLNMALGTPVLNVRFSKTLFASSEGRQSVRNLIEAFFKLGGMQIQISVVDQDLLRAAIAHPEQHEDLIVRVGGFSAHFNTLSEELKRTMLERTEHLV